MHVIIESDYDALSRRGAELVSEHLRSLPETVLGLATGSTPEGLYRMLVSKYRRGELDFSRAATFNLDEYTGLEHVHTQSYRHYMGKHLFDHVNLPPARTHLPDGLAADLDSCCERYEELISACGGIDLQILGIGRDGHIGFNEPGGSLRSRTHVAVLAPETIEDNARFFDSEEEVPHFAISMGVGTIMDARSCIMLASGEKKADAVRQCLEGPVTAMLPASALQMHPDTTVILDEAAASGLEKRDYYRWLQEGRKRLQARR